MQRDQGHGRCELGRGGGALLGGVVLLVTGCASGSLSSVDTRSFSDAREESAKTGDAPAENSTEPAAVSPAGDGESPPVAVPLQPAEPAACRSELQFSPLGTPPDNYYPHWNIIDPRSNYLFWSLDWGGNDSRVQAFRWTPEQGNTALNELDEELPPPAGNEQLIDLDVYVGTVSADGNAAAGFAWRDEIEEGFYWTEAAGLRQLDFSATYLSRDGSVVLGFEELADVRRWNEFGGTSVILSDVRSLRASADLDVLAGQDTSGRAFRWTEATGKVLLGTFPGGATEAQPVLMNDAGDVIVGAGTDAATGLARLFRWTLADGMQPLEAFPELPAGVIAAPIGMSADGRVIAGNLTQNDAPPYRAFRWTEATGFEELVPGAGSSYVSYVSPSADVVIGDYGEPFALTSSFRWTAATGTRELDLLVQQHQVGEDGHLLIGNGLQGPFLRRFDAAGRPPGLAELAPPGFVPSGWSNPLVGGVSADGRLLVGEADNPEGKREGWVLRLIEVCADR